MKKAFIELMGKITKLIEVKKLIALICVIAFVCMNTSGTSNEVFNAVVISIVSYYFGQSTARNSTKK